MALISAILNLASCGAGDVLGTGTHGCRPFMKKTFSLWLTPVGFEYDGTQEFGQTYIDSLINNGTLIVLRGIAQPENQSGDNSLTDIGGGVEVLEDEGLYKFKYNFVKGMHFNAALRSLVGFNIYDVAFVDSEGTIYGTEATTSGNWKGLTTAQISHNPMAAGDTQTGRESIVIQYPERDELDTNYVYIKKSATYNPKATDGINEVKLAWNSVPADTDTTLSIVATRNQDGAAFTGADFNDFSSAIDGTDNVLTAGDDSATTGTYVLSVTDAIASADVVTARIGTAAIPGVAVGTRNYKSNELSVTVS